MQFIIKDLNAIYRSPGTANTTIYTNFGVLLKEGKQTHPPKNYSSKKKARKW